MSPAPGEPRERGVPAVRRERSADVAPARQVLRAAFPTGAEADLVDALRERAATYLGLTAEAPGGEVVGHIAFSEVAVEGTPRGSCLALAPMAVLPAWQGAGVGGALVRAGLEACRAEGHGAVFVLGHPDYYPRFGFRPASGFGVRCPYEAPEEAFLALEIVPGALSDARGTLRYSPVFAERFG